MKLFQFSHLFTQLWGFGVTALKLCLFSLGPKLASSPDWAGVHMKWVSTKVSDPPVDCWPIMWLVGSTPWELVMCEVWRIICLGLGVTGRKGFWLWLGWLEGGELGAEFEVELVLLELLGVMEEDDGVDVEDNVEFDSVPEITLNK